MDLDAIERGIVPGGRQTYSDTEMHVLVDELPRRPQGHRGRADDRTP